MQQKIESVTTGQEKSLHGLVLSRVQEVGEIRCYPLFIQLRGNVGDIFLAPGNDTYVCLIALVTAAPPGEGLQTHSNGIVTRYGHLYKSLVRVGQHVKLREKIGLMGSTGRSTGTHLHYEVVVDGKAQDPLRFLKAGRALFSKD